MNADRGSVTPGALALWLAACALPIALFILPASAQSLDEQWRACLFDRYQSGISPNRAACTAIINTPGETPDNQALALDARGVESMHAMLLGGNRRAEALADFNRAIELNAHTAKYYFDRGQIYLIAGQDGDIANARLDFDHALELDPNYADALIRRAQARRWQGDKQGQIADLDRAVVLAANAHAFTARASAYEYGLHDLPRAIADYSKAVDLEPLNADHYVDRSQALRAHHDFAAALSDLDAAITLAPFRAAELRSARCFVRAASGADLDQAALDCAAALAEQFPLPDFKRNDGFLHLRRGEWDAAAQDFEAALNRYQDDPWCLFGRSVARRHLGRVQDADADLAAANNHGADTVDELRGYGFQ